MLWLGAAIVGAEEVFMTLFWEFVAISAGLVSLFSCILLLSFHFSPWFIMQALDHEISASS